MLTLGPNIGGQVGIDRLTASLRTDRLMQTADAKGKEELFKSFDESSHCIFMVIFMG